MSLEDKLQQDLKTALLAGDKVTAETLRGLKSVILYAKVAEGKRDTGLGDDAILVLFAKEAKKRQESADLYAQGGSPERAQAELSEKALIETYLPAKLPDEEVAKLVDEVIASTGATGIAAMGQVIGQVRAKVGPNADGALIARLVKEKLGA